MKIETFCKKTGLTLAQCNGLKINGGIYLGSLTSMPEGVTLTAGGDIYLPSINEVEN